MTGHVTLATVKAAWITTYTPDIAAALGLSPQVTADILRDTIRCRTPRMPGRTTAEHQFYETVRRLLMAGEISGEQSARAHRILHATGFASVADADDAEVIPA